MLGNEKKTEMKQKGQGALIIGAGAFGTSIASVLTHNFEKVFVLVRSQELYEGLKNHHNPNYLPGKSLPENLIPVLSWEELKSQRHNIELMVLGIPSHAISQFCEQNAGEVSFYLDKKIPFVSLAKGIDPLSRQLPDGLLLKHFFPYRDQLTFLSGPSFAEEIVDAQVTMVSLAGRSHKMLGRTISMINTDYFKVYGTYDVKGVLLGGALKNVLAIAGGIVEGLGHNHNTRAALITMGIQDMLHFGMVYNARPETFYGLSGMGDLILSITGHLSRNKLLGLELAKGRGIDAVLSSQKIVVEGYRTAKAVHLLSERYGIYCPIFETVYKILYEHLPPKELIVQLMNFKEGPL